MKRWTVVAAVALCAGLGCEKKKGPETTPGPTGTPTEAAKGGDGGAAASATPPATPTPAEVKPKYADTTALWALAPADSTFGFVVGDGVGTRALALFNTSLKRLEGKAFAKKSLEKMAAWRKSLPVDVLDEEAIKKAGFDPTKGLAVYGGANADKPGLIVIPVGDLAAFRKTMEATTEKVGDREVDKLKELVCTTVSNRYACGPTIEAVDAAMKAHDSALATAVKALPAESRGDVEGYLDIEKTPEAAKTFEELKPFGTFKTLGGAIRFDVGGFNFMGWGKGQMGMIANALMSSAPPADLTAMTGNAVTVFRAKVDPQLLLMKAPATMPLNAEVDVRKDLLDKLTGDVQIVTAGKGLLAGAIQLRVTDTASVKKVITAVCAMAKQGGGLPVTAVVAKDDSCSGEVSLAQLKDAIGMELPPFKFNFSIVGNVLVIALGDLDPASLKGNSADAAGSPEAKEALNGAQTAVFWSRDLGIDSSSLPKDLLDKVNAQSELADALAMMNWSGSQAYDFSAAANVSTSGVKITMHATSFENDPADAKAAYWAAVEKKVTGDRPGYLAAMADIEKKFPSSLVAKRAAQDKAGGPIVGPVTGVMMGAGAAAFLLSARAIEPKEPAVVPGFGEPQPGGAKEPPAPSAPEAPKAAEPAPAPAAPKAEDKPAAPPAPEPSK